ncbi:MAG TPA: LTA synthase family protein, partial [Bacteroidia bacterium]|nr:LTA synthase family protein [Bacteroidia bacterium]
QHGLTAVVGSFPPLLGNSLIRRKGFIEFSTLGNIFQNAGYQTQFFHNGHNGFGDTDFFLKQGGFENLTDEKDFTNWKFRNELGVCDEDLYEKVYPEIWSKKDKPKLSLILTMSNHAPHEIPNDFKASHPELKNLDKKEAAFYYSDYALGKFLDQCAQHSEFKNTLFLLLADHGEIYDETDHGYKLFHIPALLLNSSRGKGTFASTCSQVDFAPTLLSEISFHDI